MDLESSLAIVAGLMPGPFPMSIGKAGRDQCSVLPGVAAATGGIQHGAVGSIFFLDIPFTAQVNGGLCV